MTTPSDSTAFDDWTTEGPEADVQEQSLTAWPGPAPDPEQPLLPADAVPVALLDADEADLVEQTRDVPWEDGDEER